MLTYWPDNKDICIEIQSKFLQLHDLRGDKCAGFFVKNLYNELINLNLPETKEYLSPVDELKHLVTINLLFDKCIILIAFSDSFNQQLNIKHIIE